MHRSGDKASFCFALALLMHNGHVCPSELERGSLQPPHRTLMNWLRQYRERGGDSFYRPRARSGVRVMTPEVVVRCEQSLATGVSVSAVARAVGSQESAFRRALLRGALLEDIVPELLQGVPNQSSAQDLDQAPLLRQSEDDHQSAYPKAELFEAIEERRVLPDVQRRERKQLKRKVAIESLPEDQRPTPLRPLNKILVDSIRMIACRAETALVGLLTPHLKKEEEARAPVRQLLVSAADIIPNPDEDTLLVRIHRMASPAHDKAIQTLSGTLNEGAFRHPETNARTIHMLV